MKKEQKRIKLYEIYNDFLKTNNNIEKEKLWRKFIDTLKTEPYAIKIDEKILKINTETIKQYINNQKDKENIFYLDEVFTYYILCFVEDINC